MNTPVAQGGSSRLPTRWGCRSWTAGDVYFHNPVSKQVRQKATRYQSHLLT